MSHHGALAVSGADTRTQWTLNPSHHYLHFTDQRNGGTEMQREGQGWTMSPGNEAPLQPLVNTEHGVSHRLHPERKAWVLLLIQPAAMTGNNPSSLRGGGRRERNKRNEMREEEEEDRAGRRGVPPGLGVPESGISSGFLLRQVSRGVRRPDTHPEGCKDRKNRNKGRSHDRCHL